MFWFALNVVRHFLLQQFKECCVGRHILFCMWYRKHNGMHQNKRKKAFYIENWFWCSCSWCFWLLYVAQLMTNIYTLLTVLLCVMHWSVCGFLMVCMFPPNKLPSAAWTQMLVCSIPLNSLPIQFCFLWWSSPVPASSCVQNVSCICSCPWLPTAQYLL